MYTVSGVSAPKASRPSTPARRCKEFFLAAQQNSFAENCRLAAETLTRDSLATLKKAK